MSIDFTVENVTSGSMNKSWFGIELTISAGAELEEDYELNSYFPDGSFKWLWEYEQHLKLMPIPFCITGLISGVITWLIASNLGRPTSSKAILQYVAVLDNLLCLEMLRAVLEFNDLDPVTEGSDIGCKIMMVVTYSIYGCSGFSYAFLSIDRFVAIWLPNVYRIYFTASNATYFLLLSTLITIGVMSPNLFFRELRVAVLLDNSQFKYCALKDKFSWFDKEYADVFTLYLPVGSVLLFNAATCVKIVHRRVTKNRPVPSSHNQEGPSEVSPKQKSVSSSSSARETRISLLLMGLALLFVATVGLGNILQDYVFKGANTYAVEQVLSIMNVGYAINSTLNGFALLILPSMRQALFRGFARISGSKQLASGTSRNHRNPKSTPPVPNTAKVFED